MPTNKLLASILDGGPRADRIVDYLGDTLDVGPDGALIFEGVLGPDKLKVMTFDRPRDARGDTGRRFLVRLTDAHGEQDRTRVFEHEASVVTFLDGLDKGLDMKLPARGVAAKAPAPHVRRGPTIRKLAHA